MHVNLPPEHAGGTLFVSTVVGPTRSAAVDGQPREVRLFMGTFGTIEIAAGDREVTLSVRRTDRIALSVVGFVLLAGCLVVTVIARRRASHPVVQVRRRTETSEAPRGQGATTENDPCI